MSEATLRVRVLGGFSVDGIDEHRLGSRKARTLLKALVLARGRPVSADAVIELVWGDSPPANPREQVSVLVSRLRRTLGAERLSRNDNGYSLVVDWLDADELSSRVAEARGALAAGRTAAARAAADAAVAIAAGELLPDDDGEWVEQDRARASALTLEGRRLAAEAAWVAGDPMAAAAAAETALASDLYDETSLRVLMRAHAALGRAGSALAAYARVKRRVAEDLGIPLSPDTEALHDAIVLGDLPVAEASPPPASAPVGRAVAFAALDAALAECSSRRAALLVIIEGEAGMGKTTVLDAWLRRVHANAHVLAGRARELTHDLPLQPLTDALAQHFAASGTEERAELLGDDAAVLAPLLGSPVSPSADAATVIPDVDIDRGRLFGALRAVVGRLAETRPVVVAFDDLHFADAATTAWIEFALGLHVPVLIVGTTRPTDAGVFSERRLIRLEPLDLDGVAALVGEAKAADVLARTGGNPLLVSALAREATGAMTLADAVARRARALGRAEDTVRAAAVLGFDVDLDLLADVLNVHATVLLPELERGVAAGLLVERGPGFGFRHELERRELEQAAGSPRRALLHRLAAGALSRREALDPVLVAEHARQGGDAQLAATWYVRAADVALARADVDAADRLLDSALALVDTAQARAARARVRIAAGRLDDAAEEAERALALSRDVAMLEVAGWVAYYRRRYDEALALADEAVRRAPGGVQASCLALAGRVRHSIGDLPEALAALETAVSADATPEAMSLARIWLASARLHEGRPSDALSILPPLSGPSAHPFAPLHARFARVLALGQAGRATEALAACDEFDGLAARSGPMGERFIGIAGNCRSWLLRWIGLVGEADDQSHRAVEAAVASGMEEARYAGLLDLVDGRLLAADVNGAACALDALVDIEDWNGTMAWHQRHRYGLLRARVALEAGDRAVAVEAATAVATDASTRGARRYELLGNAVAALASDRRAIEPAALDGVVRDLRQCAALDGWWIIAALAAAFDVPAWRRQADEMVARLVKASPAPDAVTALASRLVEANDHR